MLDRVVHRGNAGEVDGAFHLLGVAPDVGRPLHSLVDRPLRQGEAGGDVAEHHAHASSYADLLHEFGRRKLAIRGAQIADDPQRLVGGRLAFLGIEIDQQDQIRRLCAEGGLNRVMNLGVGMHRAFPIDLLPCRLTRHAPRAGGGRRIAQPTAGCAGARSSTG